MGYGCGGCYGSGYCSGCYGCAGSCYGCSGYGAGCSGCSGTAPAVKSAPPAKATTDAGTPAEAKVVVSLPEDAKLFIDGQRSKMTSTRRTFVTPTLEAGERYFYDIQAEVVRDGQVRTETRRVIVAAGQVAKVDFSDLGPAVAAAPVAESAPARLTVRVPADARLYVDGEKVTHTAGARTFETPALPIGQTFYYTVTAEVDRDGRTLSDTRRVLVEAGKKVSVSIEPHTPVALRTASK
jgi:uncharacterized protein (TIGR03000 family)